MTGASAAQLISFAPPWVKMDCKRKRTVTGLHGGLNLAVDQSHGKKPVQKKKKERQKRATTHTHTLTHTTESMREREKKKKHK